MMKTDSTTNYPKFDDKEVSLVLFCLPFCCSLCLSLQMRLSGLRLRTWTAWKTLWSSTSSWPMSPPTSPMIWKSLMRLGSHISMQDSTSLKAPALATCGEYCSPISCTFMLTELLLSYSIVKHYIAFHLRKNKTWDPRDVNVNTPQDICSFIIKKCGTVEEGFEGKKVSISFIYFPLSRY